MVTIYLALGSNLGDRSGRLAAAVKELAFHVRVTKESPIYETAPLYVADQPAFLNMALQAETDLPPLGLLDRLKEMEIRLGRVPSIRFGPRAIDIDILFYGSLRMDEERLTLPHPRIAERRFVLRPLADIAPDLVHPPTGRTIAELLAALREEDSVIPFKE